MADLPERGGFFPSPNEKMAWLSVVAMLGTLPRHGAVSGRPADEAVGFCNLRLPHLKANGRRLSSELPTLMERKAWCNQTRQLAREWSELYSLSRNGSRAAGGARGAHARKRMGVCITGQVSRLELASKVQHVVSAASQRGYVVDVVIVASAEGTVFVNGQRTRTGRQFGEHWTMGTMKRTLLRARVGRLVIDTTAQWLDPYLRREYVRRTSRRKPGFTLALKDARTRSHVRQWRAMWRCYGHFAKLAQLGGWSYDVLVRLRDDVLLLGALEAAMQPRVYTSHVVTLNCQTYDGLNDKAAVVDAKYAEPVFAGPLWHYFFTSGEALMDVNNPEQYLKAVFEHHGIPLKTVPPRLLPIAFLRPTRGGEACVELGPKSTGDRVECAPHTCQALTRLANQSCPWRARSKALSTIKRKLRRCGHAGIRLKWPFPR